MSSSTSTSPSSSTPQQQQAAFANSAIKQAASTSSSSAVNPNAVPKYWRIAGKTFLLLSTVYILGVLDMSLWWIVVVCLSYLYSEWRQHQRMNKIDKINFIREMHAGEALRACLRDQIPVWITFPDIEKAEWLASTLSDLWPMVKIATETSMMQSLTPIFDAACPSFLSAIKIHTLDLGDISPTIPGVKVHDHNQDDEIMLDIELKFAGNPKIALEAKTGPVGVVVKLANLKVIGCLRIVLKPLVGQWPCFSVLSVSFKHKPQIDFSLETGKVNMMSIPGLNAFIRTLIKDNVAFYLVWPKKIIIPILKVDDAVMAELQDTEPKGILNVTILKCRDLDRSRGLGKLNPYAKLVVNETKHKTSTKKDTAVPEWNEEFECLIHDLSTEELKISVRDQNEATLGLPANSLGECTVQLDQLRETPDITVWIPLTNCAKGEIQLRLQFKSFQTDKETVPSLRRRNSTMTRKSIIEDKVAAGSSSPSENEEKISPRLNASKAYLLVEVVKAENLAKADFIGKSDPYVQLTIGKVSVKTKVLGGTLNPAWNEKFQMSVANPESSFLQVQVKDHDRLGKDSILGELNLNILDIAAKCGKQKLTKTYDLLNTKSGTITLGLTYKAL